MDEVLPLLSAARETMREARKASSAMFEEGVFSVKLTPTDQAIIRELSRGTSLGIRDLFYALSRDEAFLYKRLKYLRENGLVERAGWGKYRLTPVGDEVSRILREVNASTTLILRDVFTRRQE